MKQKLPKATNPGHAQTQEEGGMGGGVWVMIGKDAPPSSGVTKCGFSGAVPKGPQTYTILQRGQGATGRALPTPQTRPWRWARGGLAG